MTQRVCLGCSLLSSALSTAIFLDSVCRCRDVVLASMHGRAGSSLLSNSRSNNNKKRTSYCSSDSEMTHRCSHLPNKVQTINRTPDISLLYNGWGYPLPPKNCPFLWGIWAIHNTWFLGPTLVYIPNSISIASAVFVWLTVVTNRRTDTHAHSQTALHL